MPTQRALNLETLVLQIGQHEANETEMCVMEAVAYIAGEPWSDKPQCASRAIAYFLRAYNDSVNDEVRQSLKQYIPRLIGTRGSDAIEDRRSLMAADWIVRVHTPAWLRLAGLTASADALSSLPEITNTFQLADFQRPLQAASEDADAAWQARDVAVTAKIDEVVAAAFALAWSVAKAAKWFELRPAVSNALWATARAAARAVDATGVDFQPTVDALHATIPALLDRMIDATGVTL